MILNRTGATFTYDGTTYSIGDRVVATSESAYEGCLEPFWRFAPAMTRVRITTRRIFTVRSFRLQFLLRSLLWSPAFLHFTGRKRCWMILPWTR